MKRGLSYILIIIALFGLFNLKVSHAQVNSSTGYTSMQDCTDQTGDYEQCLSIFGDPGASTTTPPQVAPNPQQQPQEPTTNACAVFWGKGTITNCFLNLLDFLAHTVLLRIAALVLYLSGTGLDWVIQKTILGMSDGIKSFTGINIAWKVIRDMMNIAFIFLLVYEAILLIIDRASTANIQKFITGLVLASILINFSLFFTKVLIDASNIVTIGLYNSIISVNQNAIIDSGSGQTSTVGGLSAPFMRALGLTNFYSGAAFSAIQEQAGGGANMFFMGMFGAVLFIIVAFVFFAISILLIVRYVTLIFLLMLSPIAYMGMGLDFMKTYQGQWWKAFNSQLLFAPVYMLMTWVILTLMTSPGFFTVSGGANWGSVIANSYTSGTGSPDAVGLIFNFIVIIALAIGSLVISKDISVKGHAYISTATKQLTSYAGGAILGGTAAIGRRTIGAGASRLQQSQRLNEWAGKSALGQFTLNRTRSAAKSSFDVRATRPINQVTSTLGIDVGKAQQGGYDKILNDRTSARQKFADSLSTDTAKEAYATRQGDAMLGLYRGGSQPNSVRTIFGVLGRSNRVVASKILEDQLKNYRSDRDKLQEKEDNLNNRLNSLNDEEAKLQAITAGGGTLTPKQVARLADLQDPNPANKKSIAYVQDELTKIGPQVANLTLEVTRREDEIKRLGIRNSANRVVTNRATGSTRDAQAQEQKF